MGFFVVGFEKHPLLVFFAILGLVFPVVRNFASLGRVQQNQMASETFSVRLGCCCIGASQSLDGLWVVHDTSASFQSFRLILSKSEILY